MGVVTISSGSTFTPGDVLEIYVSDGNVVASDSIRTVEVEVTSTLGETETIILEEVTAGRGVFAGTLATVSGNQDSSGVSTVLGKQASMVAVSGTRLRVTYMDADNGSGGKGIPRTGETTAVDTSSAPPVVSGGGGGGGCTVGNETRLNSSLLLLLITALGIRMRLRRNRAKFIHCTPKQQ